MTEPTDAELAALRSEFGITSNGRGIKEYTQVRDFARAVLAKWGTPPAVAGEHKPGCPALGGYGHGVEDCCCGATTQPTQAQAGTVPLTDAQSHALIERMANEAEQWAEGLSYEPTQEQLSGRCVAFIQREIHFAHSIKGGQHDV